ncbi:MAG: hypothetical protein CVT66_06210 [Actinobacteria bacterium HGW-Actinobacteria-6]|nr:MAG: hypothetical protein CVT66_06210 [Actinobacteria bacterium HGW-Actinobacteria-6]
MPKVVTHTFGPFMVSNRKWGKIVPPYFSIGVKTWPVDQAQLDVEVEDQHSRITATRVLAGGLLLGPAGMILGALARKDVTKGRLVLTVDGRVVQRFEFPGRDVGKAEAFIDALAQAKE